MLLQFNPDLVDDYDSRSLRGRQILNVDLIPSYSRISSLKALNGNPLQILVLTIDDSKKIVVGFS